MSEWSSKNLGEIAENISRPFDFEGKSKVVFINTGDVLQGKFLHSNYSDVEGLPGQAKKAIKKGDILYSEIRPGNKRYVYVDFDAEDYVVSTKFMVVRPISDEISSEFLYMLLTGKACEEEFKIIADSRSGTFPQITFDAVAYYPISYPEADEQERLVSISNSLLKKIELNRQTNHTLEEIAQAIFKSWFVDFEPTLAKIFAKQNGQDPERSAMAAISGKTIDALDHLNPEQQQSLKFTAALFPDTLTDSELGQIPEGWEVKPLSSFGNVVCGKTPSKKKSEYYDGGVPFIKIPDMHGNMYVIKTIDSLSTEGANTQAKKILPAGSVCVSCIATVGQVLIASENSFTNQQINSIVPSSEYATPYLYFSMLGLYDHLHDLASGGSATLNLNTGNFSKIEIIRPCDRVLHDFSTLVEPIMAAVLANYHQQEALSSIRDTLLPKLLSGELEVIEKEKAVANG